MSFPASVSPASTSLSFQVTLSYQYNFYKLQHIPQVGTNTTLKMSRTAQMEKQKSAEQRTAYVAWYRESVQAFMDARYDPCWSTSTCRILPSAVPAAEAMLMQQQW